LCARKAPATAAAKLKVTYERPVKAPLRTALRPRLGLPLGCSSAGTAA